MPDDCYIVLGIAPDADPGQIRRAYRRLVRLYHPDASEADAERFMKVQRAFETLTDAQARRRHDEKLGVEKGPVAPGGAEPPLARRARSTRPRNVLDEFLGGRTVDVSGQGSRSPARDLFVEILLEPHEALTGGIIPLRLPVRRVCPACRGAGHRGLLVCGACDGAGRQLEHDIMEISIPPRVASGTRVRLPLDDVGIPGVHLVVLVTVLRARRSPTR